VDETGKPFPGATVTVLASGAKEPVTATSDARGEFTVKGLAVGDAVVVVQAKSRVTSTQKVKVTKDPVRADATMRLGVRFAGKLRDLRDAPVCGATVQPEQVTEDGRFVTVAPSPSTSGADGAFVADGLEPGSSYRLRISHAKFLTVELPGYPAEAGAVRDDLDVTLEDAAWLSGVVVDLAGKPVAAARVSAAGADAEPTGPDAFFRRWLRSMGITWIDSLDDTGGDPVDAQGRFQLGSLAPGDAEVVAHAPGYFRSTVKVADLAAGKGREGLKVVLEPATAWVEGVVVDQDGKPLSGATVTAHGDEGRAGTATTDAQGKFKLVKVRSRGPVRLSVDLKGYVDDADGEVALNSSGHKRSIAKAARLKVKVLDPQGRPVEGATVTVTVGEEGEKPSRHVYQQFSQPEGGYDLETRPGRVEVQVTVRGFGRQTVGAWKLAPGQTLDAGTFTLAKRAPVDEPEPEDEDEEEE
jgi:protocatechuate 3,4-dioxygenase beta subunit